MDPLPRRPIPSPVGPAPAPAPAPAADAAAPAVRRQGGMTITRAAPRPAAGAAPATPTAAATVPPPAAPAAATRPALQMPALPQLGLPAARPRIGLCMIVKDEATVIGRCLRSVAPLIDRYTLVDTGSSDGTQDVVRAVAAELGLPGELHERPWRDFGHNRSEALDLARPHSDYLLVIDADEILALPPGWTLPQPLNAPAYSLRMHDGTLRYLRTSLVDARLPWRYIGVLHEYIDCGKAIHPVELDGPHVIYTRDGARARNPNKSREDAQVLEAALRSEPGNTRYQFYLAQSWMGAGELERALDAYEARVAMGGWDQEVWCAMYLAARLRERLARPAAEVIDAYLRAYDFRPSRAEVPVALAGYLRRAGRWASARAVIVDAMRLKPGGDHLFVESDCYGWRRLDELSLILMQTGEKPAARTLLLRALNEGSVPAGQVEAVKARLAACG
ncbi:tetratricopeptide repeat-containing glycosyltransferase [Aquariibacter albus]|nr:glycosyltransferase family 2 protein [Aquariibacter albus]